MSNKWTYTTSQMDHALAVAEKITKVAENARKCFIARNDAIEMLSVAYASGLHGAFLAKPGTAKTSLIQYFANSFQCRFYYTALKIDTESDELFGPNDPMTLDQAVWTRKLAGLAKATLAFLDEAGKAPSEVQNLVLGAMQERHLPVGDDYHKLPLHSLFTATNETLDDNPAFWDRFHLRLPLSYINEASDFLKMVVSVTDDPEEIEVSDADFANLRHVTRCMAINPTKNALKTLGTLWSTYKTKFPNQEPLSDRRWKETLVASAGSALLGGRDAIQIPDLYVSRFMLWTDLADVGKVDEWVSELTHKEKKTYIEKSELLKEIEAEFANLKPSADIKEKTPINYKATKLLQAIKGMHGPEWDDLRKRIEILQASILQSDDLI